MIKLVVANEGKASKSICIDSVLLGNAATSGTIPNKACLSLFPSRNIAEEGMLISSLSLLARVLEMQLREAPESTRVLI